VDKQEKKIEQICLMGLFYSILIGLIHRAEQYLGCVKVITHQKLGTHTRNLDFSVCRNDEIETNLVGKWKFSALVSNKK